MGSCPNEDEIARFLDGTLDAASRSALVAHAAECAACVSLIGALAPAALADCAAPPDEQRIGRYEIVRTIGAGGMGVVYEARDPELRRKVALKVLRPRREGSPQRDDLVLKEARAAAAIAHPNAVAIFDVGEVDGVAYMTMELVDGPSLRALMDGGGIALDERVRWLLDVARVLAVAHERGIVHRDIKPENVMVRADGVVKVLDFGIARRTVVAVDAAAATIASGASSLASGFGAGAVVGTPAYMAPEQLRGAPVDGASDQFSWGVLAYEVLTGKRPWATNVNVVQLVAQITSYDPEPPSAVKDGLPPALDAVVMRALAKDRRARFPSMLDAAAALERASAAPSATLVSALAPEPKPPRRRSRFAIAAAMVLAAIALLAVARLVTRGETRGATVAPSAARAPAVGPPDFGSTMSSNPEALAAYTAGVQAYRDAARQQARTLFERAATLDPSFAAAHLRRALSFQTPDDDSRDHLRKATQLRSALGDHDRALLDTIEPWMRVPADARELAARVDRLESTAKDGDSLYLACVLRGELDDYGHALEACRAAGAADPTAAAPRRSEGLNLVARGDAAGAMQAYRECLRLAPSSTSCLADLHALTTDAGECAEALALARRLVAADPATAHWRRVLATALFSASADVDPYLEALNQYLDALPAEQRSIQRASALAKIAALQGDFAEARRRLDEWKRALSTSSQEIDHEHAFEFETELETELGRSDRVAAAAREYARQRGAWTPYAYFDFGMSVAGALYRSDAIDRAALAAQRETWLAKPREVPEGLAWIEAWARPARTADDAHAALNALPAFLPLPGPLGRTPHEDEPVGALYLTAGDAASALPFLERAAHSCSDVELPFEHLRAALELAEARAALGDAPGACEAAAGVLARWGGRPSTTADSARRLRERLSCAK